jgi:transposase
MGGQDRSSGQRHDHVAGDSRRRVDPKKRTLAARERDETVRAAWRETVTAFSSGRLVFVDTGKNTTLLAALMPGGLPASMVVEGATDTAVMTVFVEQVLAPQLLPGQVVVWDNLNVHKARHLTTLIEGCGCEVLFLPPYSPDFNPIELAFSKLKSALRQVEARTLDALWDVIGRLLATITPADVHGWYRHCGYTLDGLPI